MGTRLIQAPTDFLTLPNPSFFSFLSDSEGNGKNWICRPDQKADFGHLTHPGPHRFSHPAKSKFFSFLSDSEGNGKKLDLPPRPKGVAGALKSPKQKPLKSPSTAQIRRKSAANSRKSAQIRPPFCNSAPFRPTRPLGKTMKIAYPSGRQYPP